MTYLRASIVGLVFLLVLIGTFWLTTAAFKPSQSENSLELETLGNEVAQLSSRIGELPQADDQIGFPPELLWIAQTRKDAERALQERILATAQQLDVSFSSFRASRVSKNVTQNTIAFEFEAQTSLTQAYRLLAELERLSPHVAISALRLRPTRQIQAERETSQDITVYQRVIVWAYWAEGQI